MPAFLTLGELLIDFVPTITPTTLIAAPAFVKAPGGAPANVAVGLARLGHTVGFLGRVGDDPFGHFLAETLTTNGVDITGLKFDPAARTALAFVSLKPDGDRDFLFYRHPSADMRHTPEDIDPALIQSAQVLHYGSISLIADPAHSATLHAISLAQQHGLTLSYDPNLRLPLWPSAEAARAGLRLGLQHAHIVKISQDEIHFLTGETDLVAGARQLWQPTTRLMAVTLGPHGCLYLTADRHTTLPGYTVAAIDATGAGDGFTAGLLHGLHTRGLLTHPTDPADLTAVCQFANAVGALTTTRRGAIPALPTLAAVNAFLQGQP